MKQWMKFPKLALLLGVSLALVISGVVLATIITVDGDPSDWPAGALLTTDPNEALVPDEGDIKDVYATNSGPATIGSAYFMLQSYGVPMEFDLGDTLYICVDTDNSDVTGATLGGGGFPTSCTDAEGGIDRVIEIYRDQFGTLYSCDNSGCSTVLGGVPSWSFNAANATIEVSVLLSDLGITALQDGQTLPVVFYYDTDDLNDDNVPDSGSLGWPVGTGSPTAITLSSLNAHSGVAMPTAFALIAATLAGGAGLFVLSRRRKA